MITLMQSHSANESVHFHAFGYYALFRSARIVLVLAATWLCHHILKMKNLGLG